MAFEFLRSGDRKDVLKKIEEMYGLEDLGYMLFNSGKERIVGFSGNMSRDDIIRVAGVANVEVLGLYLFKREKEEKLKMSFDATQIFGNRATKRVVEIDAELSAIWMSGEEIDFPAEKGLVIMKNRETGDFMGCGKSNGVKIINQVPKERRAKKVKRNIPA